MGVDEPDLASRVRRKIFQIDRLAAMPTVVWRIVEALGDPRTEIDQIARLIESDPGLTSKLLRLANSVFYGQAGKVTTIRRAVIVVGFDELEILTVSAGFSGMLGLKQGAPPLEGPELWRHCLAVSWISRELATHAGSSLTGEAMIAGLLHDLGKLLLASHLPDELKSLRDLTDQGLPYDQAEEHLGIRHDLTGSWLASRWGLPEMYAVVIRDHHNVETQGPHRPLVCQVALANVMAKSLGLGQIVESPRPDLKCLVRDAGLSAERIRQVTEKAMERVPRLFEIWRGAL